MTSTTGGGTNVPPDGKPFGDQFRGPVVTPGSDEALAVAAQARQLRGLGDEDTLRRLAQQLSDRHLPADADAGVSTVVQIRFLPTGTRGSKHPTLIVPDEILVRIDRVPSWWWRIVSVLLTVLRWLHLQSFRVVEETTPLSSRVLRLRSPRGRQANSLGVVTLLTLLQVRADASICMTTSSGPQKPLGANATGLGGGLGPGSPGGYALIEPPVFTIGVIDTGITSEQRTDQILDQASGVGGFDPLDAFPISEVPNADPPITQKAPDGILDRSAGHGTFVAGIIGQITRSLDTQVRIRVYRAVDSDGAASEYDVALAMVRAVEEGAHLLNVSCAARTLKDTPAIALEAALEVIDNRAVVVAAAGNVGGNIPMWPAGFAADNASVISVSSLQEWPDGTAPVRSPWACFGAWVKVWIVGVGIESTYVQDPQLSPRPNPMARWTGTSFAAPQIAAAIARIAVTAFPGSDPVVAAQAAAGALLTNGARLIDPPLGGDLGPARRILRGVEV